MVTGPKLDQEVKVVWCQFCVSDDDQHPPEAGSVTTRSHFQPPKGKSMFESKTELAPLGGAFSPNGLALMSGSAQRHTGREIERVQAQALVADVKEQGRALLTNTALQNVGALSALESHLIQVAPLGEARYKHIVDAYAMGAAQAIARW